MGVAVLQNCELHERIQTDHNSIAIVDIAKTFRADSTCLCDVVYWSVFACKPHVAKAPETYHSKGGRSSSE